MRTQAACISKVNVEDTVQQFEMLEELVNLFIEGFRLECCYAGFETSRCPGVIFPTSDHPPSIHIVKIIYTFISTPDGASRPYLGTLLSSLFDFTYS